MKPFLLIQSRPETAASDNEYEAFLKFSSLNKTQLQRFRIESSPLPTIKLEDYSGIIVGGGPFNASDPLDVKSEAQIRTERELHTLLDTIITQDFPFLGACYGIGVVVSHQQGLVTRKYSEDIGPTKITLTDEGKNDPLLAGIPPIFDAFVGHKEACEILPKSATLLASSELCPTQMFRIKNNVYVTQFHPELDSHGLEVRINIYKHAGYFPPETANDLIAQGHASNVMEPVKVLQNFITRYATPRVTTTVPINNKNYLM